MNTWANAVIAVLAQTLISAAIWIALGRAMPDVTLLTRFFATAAPFLIFPVAFFVRLIVVHLIWPKKMLLGIETLENCLTSSERRKAVKDILGRYLEEGNEILRDPNTKSRALPWGEFGKTMGDKDTLLYCRSFRVQVRRCYF